MYRIDADSNKITKLTQRSFGELGFKEREHLQEWIAKEPSVLGEELLIIQKEFAGFSDTQERLDLLALDKQGSLVVIENKLDDSGKDVTWQAQKYASYCSKLTKENIENIFQDYLKRQGTGEEAREALSAFFDDVDYEELTLNRGISQRIILVAGRFRKEVTSTVLWLLNYNVRIQCFRATPFSLGDELFLSVEQVIPTPDAEDYMIGMAEKARVDVDSQVQLKNRHIVRKEFWANLLVEMNKKSNLFQNISPGIASWISAGSGVRGVAFNHVVTKTYGRAELYIDRGDKDENNFVFKELHSCKNEIEDAFGGDLVWEPLEERRACRIKVEVEGNVYEKDLWDGMISSMTDNMAKLEPALKDHLSSMNQKLKTAFP